MPVVTTMTLIALFMRRGGSDFSLFDAEGLQSRLETVLEDTPPETRDAALATAAKVAALLDDYRSNVDASIDAYIAETNDEDAAADDLIERIAPIDQQRTAMLRQLIEYRQDLVELLDDAQWEAVFA